MLIAAVRVGEPNGTTARFDAAMLLRADPAGQPQEGSEMPRNKQMAMHVTCLPCRMFRHPPAACVLQEDMGEGGYPSLRQRNRK